MKPNKYDDDMMMFMHNLWVFALLPPFLNNSMEEAEISHEALLRLYGAHAHLVNEDGACVL